MPLPFLSKLLGHKSVRTTSLYWLNVYSEPEPRIKPLNDAIADILLVKEWLDANMRQKPKPSPPSQPQPEPLIISKPEPVLAVEPPRQTTNTAPNIAENFPLNEPEPPTVQPLVNQPPAEKASQTEPKPEAKPA